MQSVNWLFDQPIKLVKLKCISHDLIVWITMKFLQ